MGLPCEWFSRLIPQDEAVPREPGGGSGQKSIMTNCSYRGGEMGGGDGHGRPNVAVAGAKERPGFDADGGEVPLNLFWVSDFGSSLAGSGLRFEFSSAFALHLSQCPVWYASIRPKESFWAAGCAANNRAPDFIFFKFIQAFFCHGWPSAISQEIF